MFSRKKDIMLITYRCRLIILRKIIIMNRSRFFSLSLFIVIIFVFLKIYQHNQIVTLVYKKQRIEKIKAEAIKKRNLLLVQLSHRKNQHDVRKKATNVLGMRPLKPSQVVTLTDAILK